MPPASHSSTVPAPTTAPAEKGPTNISPHLHQAAVYAWQEGIVRRE
jgi:hypothetical protein